jgi:glycosyltransferase involved in cell wall biosynthesis
MHDSVSVVQGPLVRIALITAGTRGPGSYTLNLAKALKARGHDVLLVSETAWRKEPFEPIFEAKSWSAFGMIPIVPSMREQIRHIEAFKPDIIHHQWPSGTSDYFFGQVLRLGIPTIATIHVSIDSHDMIFDRFFSIHYTTFLPLLRSLSGLISISEFIAAQVRRRRHLPEGIHHVVYAGVDETVFAPIERTRSDELRLLFVGQIMPEKGVDVLIEAARRARRTRPLTLTIVGEGVMKSVLQARTRDLDWVRWVGFMSHQKQIAEQYAQADLTVLPTRWEEAFSLVPVESMACGTPVLSTRKGGTPEIVLPGRTGYLIEECDPGQIAEVLLSASTDELEAMRSNCRAIVMERHTFRTWIDAHERIYASAIESRVATAAG